MVLTLGKVTYPLYSQGRLGENAVGMFLVRTAIENNSVEGFDGLPNEHKNTLLKFIDILKDKGKFELMTSDGVIDYSTEISEFRVIFESSQAK